MYENMLSGGRSYTLNSSLFTPLCIILGQNVEYINMIS